MYRYTALLLIAILFIAKDVLAFKTLPAIAIKKTLTARATTLFAKKEEKKTANSDVDTSQFWQGEWVSTSSMIYIEWKFLIPA